MDTETLCWEKLLLIIGIVILSLASYLYFAPNNSNIRHKKLPLDKFSRPSIAGFYHFGTMNKPWKSIVYEQILLANLSGLINASSNIYVTGLGNITENKTIYNNIFINSKFIYEYNTKKELYEFVTLKKLEKFCLDNNESLVWYAHSKGASHPIDDMMVWRGALNYFVLDKWQLCKELLSSTNYTTCGAILVLDSFGKAGWNTYYAGNMWWAKCSHINRLTRIDKLDQNNRYLAELYVTSEPVIGHFNCFSATPGYLLTFNKQNANCTVNQPILNIR